MNNNLAEEYKKELLKNSKYKLLFVNSEEKKENTNNSNNSNITNNIYNNTTFKNNQDNVTNNQGDFEKSERFKNLPNLTEEQKAEYKRLNERFKELRGSHSLTKADREAEEYLSNLRDIGEYNRWSLKLTQKWLMKFYNGNYLYLFILHKYYRQILDKYGNSHAEI
jgi:hypothetical protein